MEQKKKRIFKSKETMWKNSQGVFSFQKIFTNISLIISSLLAYIYIVIDMINNVQFSQFHCIIILVTMGFGLLYKEMSNRLFLKLDSFKLTTDGIEVDFKDNDDHNTTEDEETKEE